MAIFDQGGPSAEYDTVWFVSDGTMDWSAILRRESRADPWELRYRFRYYRGPDAWDGRDIKNEYVVIHGDRQRLRDAADLCCQGIMAQLGPGARRWKVPVRGDYRQLIERLKPQPWFHTKTIQVDGAPPDLGDADGAGKE
jgi:hypothetical protein